MRLGEDVQLTDPLERLRVVRNLFEDGREAVHRSHWGRRRCHRRLLLRTLRLVLHLRRLLRLLLRSRRGIRLFDVAEKERDVLVDRALRLPGRRHACEVVSDRGPERPDKDVKERLDHAHWARAFLAAPARHLVDARGEKEGVDREQNLGDVDVLERGGAHRLGHLGEALDDELAVLALAAVVERLEPRGQLAQEPEQSADGDGLVAVVEHLEHEHVERPQEVHGVRHPLDALVCHEVEHHADEAAALRLGDALPEGGHHEGVRHGVDGVLAPPLPRRELEPVLDALERDFEPRVQLVDAQRNETVGVRSDDGAHHRLVHRPATQRHADVLHPLHGSLRVRASHKLERRFPVVLGAALDSRDTPVGTGSRRGRRCSGEGWCGRSLHLGRKRHGLQPRGGVGQDGPQRCGPSAGKGAAWCALDARALRSRRGRECRDRGGEGWVGRARARRSSSRRSRHRR
mmetsp:Transcript_31094/g.101340  ORF Transcript_31094/g.101340 Transcript_31094/m.101340 type:complete len:460 (-) Transcript_31094:924-2303(-)